MDATRMGFVENITPEMADYIHPLGTARFDAKISSAQKHILK